MIQYRIYEIIEVSTKNKWSGNDVTHSVLRDTYRYSSSLEEAEEIAQSLSHSYDAMGLTILKVLV